MLSMNRSGVRTQSAEQKRDILFCTDPCVAISVIVDPTTLTADPATGLRVIKAGEALQGPADLYADRGAHMQVARAAASGGNVIYGVTQHDIKFTADETQANANCIIFGFIDPMKMEEDVKDIPADVVTALAGKVWFIDGNKKPV